MLQKLKQLLLIGPVTPNLERKKHLKKVKLFLLAVSIYAVSYGIYEYFAVYKNLELIKILGEWTNWTLMFGGFLLLVILVTRFNFEKIVMGLLYMFTLEDLVYWMSQWASTDEYPFPALNWWSYHFASFRVLGDIGQPLPFWPDVPLFYIPAFGIMIVYIVLSLRDSRYSRAFSWIVGPIFAAILIGTIGKDYDAILLLMFVPLSSYVYAVGLYILKKKGIIIVDNRERDNGA
ncbi:MAG: hypothetical protein ACFFCS_17720 [Candidatus Hodarchaeota archaeon]